MSTSLKRQTAEQRFHKGQSLFEENRYEQALVELRGAEEIFRELDARGHPFGNTLSNGVSGLANTLALTGRCHQKLNNFDQATTYFETSYINAKFEKTKPFRAFLIAMKEDLAACYENKLGMIDEKTLDGILNQDVDIDTNFQFPFSLGKNAFPLARLYELDPERYPQFKDFYNRSKKNDSALRRVAGKELDESRMKRATMSIWVILGALWVIYGLIVVKALLRK